MDIFALHLDDSLGQPVFSKLLGIAAILVYVWGIGLAVGAIGLHRRHIWKALLVGGMGAAVFFAMGYAIQLLIMSANGEQATLSLTALHLQTGIEASELLALWFVFAAGINALMDEGLFRGVLLPYFRAKHSFWRALVIQAVLFAAWHLVWPIEDFLNDDASATDTLLSAMGWFGSTFVMGMAWGYMYLKTNSLWASWIAHTINNATIAVLYIRTSDGLTSADEFAAFAYIFMIGMLVIMLWVKLLSKRIRLTGADAPTAASQLC